MFCQLKHGAHAGAAALPAGNEQEAEVPLRAVDGHAAQIRAQVFGRGRGQQADAHPGAGQQEQLLQRPGVKDRVSFQTQLIVVLAQQLLGVAPGVLLRQDQGVAPQLLRRNSFFSGKGMVGRQQPGGVHLLQNDEIQPF